MSQENDKVLWRINTKVPEGLSQKINDYITLDQYEENGLNNVRKDIRFNQQINKEIELNSSVITTNAQQPKLNNSDSEETKEVLLTIDIWDKSNTIHSNENKFDQNSQKDSVITDDSKTNINYYTGSNFGFKSLPVIGMNHSLPCTPFNVWFLSDGQIQII
jgi:hypothetical protein